MCMRRYVAAGRQPTLTLHTRVRAWGPLRQVLMNETHKQRVQGIQVAAALTSWP